MKKYFLAIICVLLFNMVEAQTSAVNDKKPLIQVKGDAPTVNTVASDPRTARPKLIINPNPPPKGDPARAEMAKKKRPQIIQELKTN